MSDCHCFSNIVVYDVVDVEAKALIKERQKKDNHNLSEYCSVFTG